MYSENVYILSFLPGIIALSEPAEVSIEKFLEALAENDQTGNQVRLAEAIFLSDDLLQRDASLAGSPETPEPAVLTGDQITGDEDLPDYLTVSTTSEMQTGPKIPSDIIWDRYFHYVADLAKSLGNKFLASWVTWEVTMRNASAEARARALELEGSDYVVATDIEGWRDDFNSIVNEWSTAANPLEAQRTLDRARWNWIRENENHFSFSNDELIAYAAKLLLNVRWQRLNKAMESHQHHADENISKG